jgi:hypothetical protein
MEQIRRSQRGDTLIEVTFALAILGFVLLGSTAIAATAFRMGQTAKERTEVADEAQRQMEALRSFRDNNDWTAFLTGPGGGYSGVSNVSGPCGAVAGVTGSDCFHMEIKSPVSGVQEFVPVGGSTNANVPTAVIEIKPLTPAGVVRNCGMDFALYYQFTPIGGSSTSNPASNQIVTRLVNLRYNAPLGGSCP